MTKELRELLAKREQMRAQIRALLGEDKLDEAEKLKKDFDALGKKIALLQEIEADDDNVIDDDDDDSIVKAQAKDLEKEYSRIFMAGLRRRRISAEDRSIVREYNKIRAAVMHEGGVVPAIPLGDSTLIVPVDAQTRINKLMRELNDLSQYVNVQNVNTDSGSRVLEADNAMVPFAPVVEYDPLLETDNPQFVPIAYNLVKRGGHLPLTNELLSDSDQNVLGYVEDWLAKKMVVTRTSLITTRLLALAPQALADVDAIKQVLNVALDPAISLTSVILTNQDGYHWLDTQKDGDGRYLLQDDITQPGRKLFKGRPVVVASNRYVPSIVGPPALAPIFIGNLKQLIVLFTRGLYELASTKEGGDAWRRDTTELRAITRDDCVQWDASAAVYGQLAI